MKQSTFLTFTGAALSTALLAAPATAQVLLIPDSAGDKIWAFHPYTGNVIDDTYVPDDGNMIQPINAVDSGHGTILVSDENADAVLEYGYDGTFIGVVAGPGDGLDALQGVTVYEDEIYVGSRSTDVIYRISMDGSSVAVWADAGVGTPRDQVFRASDAITSNSDTESSGGENLEQFDFDGNFLGTFHDSDGVDGIDFPQQIKNIPGGGILAAGFTAPRGLYVYDSDGNQVAAYTDIITSPRGVHRLGNGQLLYAGGTRVMRFDPMTNTEETVVNMSGTSFRYIEYSVAPAPCPGDLDGDTYVFVSDLQLLLDQFGPCDPDVPCTGDLDGNGRVNGRDVMQLATSFGPCDGSGPPLNPSVMRPMTPGAVGPGGSEDSMATGPCPGDLDGDGHVYASDLQLLLAQFGPCDPNAPCASDLNGSGSVNANDILLLAMSFGKCDGATQLRDAAALGQ